MKVVVTGSGGFVGGNLVEVLRKRGDDVTGIARRPSTLSGVVSAQLDLSSCSVLDLTKALAGAEVVFHTAAKVGMWGKREEFFATNVLGTQKLLEAAQKTGVRRFIYTSSPSVIANGKDLCGVNENVSYPQHFEAFYPETKSIAEREVLSAHTDGFRTVALRPHLIFGPHDTNLIPTIVAKARAGRLAIIGTGKNLCDFSFIDDCVQAHLCAERSLRDDPTVGGRAYFISQGEPMNLWEFIAEVLKAYKLPPLSRRVSYGFAYTVAALCESLAKVVPGFEPPLSRFLVSEMATNHYFDISAAKSRLGYQPLYSMKESLALTFSA